MQEENFGDDNRNGFAFSVAAVKNDCEISLQQF